MKKAELIEKLIASENEKDLQYLELVTTKEYLEKTLEEVEAMRKKVAEWAEIMKAKGLLDPDFDVASIFQQSSDNCVENV